MAGSHNARLVNMKKPGSTLSSGSGEIQRLQSGKDPHSVMFQADHQPTNRQERRIMASLTRKGRFN